MKEIEIKHPITHDGIEYGRGLHELDDDLAEVFLNIRDADGNLLNSAIDLKAKPRGKVAPAADAPGMTGFLGAKMKAGKPVPASAPTKPPAGTKTDTNQGKE